MLQITNENNHSAVVRASTNKDIETSIATENIRGNNVTKTTSETPTVEMENIDVPTHLWAIWVGYLKRILQIIV